MRLLDMVLAANTRNYSPIKFYTSKYKIFYLLLLLLIFFYKSDCSPRLPEIVYPSFRHTTRKLISSTPSSPAPISLSTTSSPLTTSSLNSSTRAALALALGEELKRRQKSQGHTHTDKHELRAETNASVVQAESDAWPSAPISKTEIRRSQSSRPDSNQNNGDKNKPVLIVASSAEVGLVEPQNAQTLARIIGTATDAKGSFVLHKYHVSSERIDGDSDGDTISSKNYSQIQKNNNDIPRLNSGRSIVDELNSEELRRTTMREFKDSSSLTPTPLTTPTGFLPSTERESGGKHTRAHAVALKIPEFVRPKNMELADEPKSLHLISHDTSEAKGNDNNQKSDILALHSSKTLTDTLPLERPKSSSHQQLHSQTYEEQRTQSQPSRSSITLAEMEKMRKRLWNANRKRVSASYEDSTNEPRRVNQIQQQRNELKLPPQPLNIPFIAAPAVAIEGAPQINYNRKPGEPDHTILPPLLTPPPMFSEVTTSKAIENVSVKANAHIGSKPMREKSNLKRRLLNSPDAKHTIQSPTLPKVDEYFDLLMPPKVQPEPQFYGPQQILDPNQRILSYTNDLSLRPHSPNSIISGNYQPSVPELSTIVAPSLTAFIPVNVLNPNAKLDLCCKKQAVSQSCQSLCNFDTFTDKSLVNAVLHGQCPGPELGKAFDCATSKVDHSACCRRAGIHTYSNGQCMPFCQTNVPTPPNIFNYVACLQVFDTIKNCYRDYQLTSPNIYGD